MTPVSSEDPSEQLNAQGRKLLSEKAWEEAYVHFTRALEQFPGVSELHVGQGIALLNLDEPMAAAGAFRTAVGISPGYANAWANLGVAFTRAELHEQALIAHRQAAAASPNDEGVLHNLGVTLGDLRRHGEAAEAYAACLALDPAHIPARLALASSLLHTGDIAGALSHVEHAGRIAPTDPEVHWALAHQYLLHDRFVEGFDHYEWRHKIERFKLRAVAKPMTDRNVQGKTLVLRGEQGFGDMMLFSRFGRLLRERGARVVLEVHPELVGLLSQLNVADSVVAFDTPVPNYDAECYLMSVPWALGLTKDELERSLPASAAAQRSAGAPLRIGLFWQGNPKNVRDWHRSVPLERLEGVIAARPEATFVSLQKGHGEEIDPDLPFAHRIERPVIRSFADTAEIIRSLDLVIGIDSAAAHLAGALGKPLWVMYSSSPDWRWGLDEQSFWYPSARVIRQETLGKWDSVLSDVERRLREFRL